MSIANRHHLLPIIKHSHHHFKEKHLFFAIYATLALHNSPKIAQIPTLYLAAIYSVQSASLNKSHHMNLKT